MSELRPSHRSTREGPLLVLAAAIVCSVCIPLYQWSSASDKAPAAGFTFTSDRVQKLLLGPEKIACYCAFTWGMFILTSRWLEVRRQRRALALGLLPTEEGARILPEDARPLLRKAEQLSQNRPFILTSMIRQALNRFALTRSGADANEAVRTQADVEMGRMVSSFATVTFLAWAIPALGFLGTVRGLGMSIQGDIDKAMANLYYVFDTTLIALLVSLPLMFFLHSVQRDEESLVLDCQQYCLEHLVARLYDPDASMAHGENAGGSGTPYYTARP